MIRSSVPKEDRDKMGLTESLVRVSVGIENVKDLIEDVNQTFKVIKWSPLNKWSPHRITYS